MRFVRVPLRISLIGGGSDLPSHYRNHGGAVVSFTIDKYIYIIAKQNLSLFPHNYRLIYSQVEEGLDLTEIRHPIIRTICRDYKIDNLDLDIMSDIPSGTGMGSSSAFAIGMHAALGPSRDKRILAELACKTEITDLKEPIGKQDQYAAAYGGLNLFEFNRDDRVVVRPIELGLSDFNRLKNSLTLVYLGKSRSASKLLHKQEAKDNSKILAQLEASAQVLASYLRLGKIQELGPIINHGWELKKRLSPEVSNSEINNIIDTALKNGASGGKLLGAGGTGFVLLFCPIENKIQMLKGLSPLNLRYVPFNFDYEGVKVLYEDNR